VKENPFEVLAVCKVEKQPESKKTGEIIIQIRRSLRNMNLIGEAPL